MTSFLIKRAKSIVVFYFLVSMVASVFVVKLFANLRPDIEELLPTTSRSVQDLKEVTSRLRSIDNLAVLIFSENSQAAAQFQADLAARLEKHPQAVHAGVEYRITEELQFFEKRKALFLSVEDLLTVEKFIRERIDYEKSLYNPLNLVLPDELPEPKFDIRELEKKYSSKASSFSQYPGGVYSTPEGKQRLILVYAPDQSITTAHKLKNQIVETVKELNPQSYSSDIQVLYSGNVQDIIEEQAALMEDLVLSTVIVTLLVLLVLWLYFRSLFATVALVTSLMVGTIITFGISYFVVGYLNANSAFMGSIVMGNGINFGIMILARYLEERRARLLSHDHALSIALKETVLPTLAASLAAGAAYGSLMVTSFRGFSQFGIIGLIGMVSCWIVAFTFFPAAITWVNQISSIVGSDRRTESRMMWSNGLRIALVHFTKPVAWVGLLITLISAGSFLFLGDHMIESDLTKLRDRRSMTEGSGYLTKYIDHILKRYSSPLALLTQTEDEARRISVKLNQMKDALGTDSGIESVLRVQDFVPEQQADKIKILRRIKEILSPKILWRLPETEKAKVATFLNPAVFSGFTVKDLPEKLVDRFREKDGKIGTLVLVEPPIVNQLRERKPLVRFVEQLRSVADTVASEGGSKIPVAGRLPVSADMLSAIIKDGPIATVISGVAVVILTLLLFRNFALSIMVLGALFIGVVWMVAGMVLDDIKINFLNFVALPITFGIGVDYAVNVFQRFREERAKSLGFRVPMIRAVYHTGGAVVLASLTTIIGWGSLLIAGNQAFVSFGKLAVLGEVTCLLVAVLFLPAMIMTFRSRVKPT